MWNPNGAIRRRVLSGDALDGADADRGDELAEAHAGELPIELEAVREVVHGEPRRHLTGADAIDAHPMQDGKR